MAKIPMYLSIRLNRINATSIQQAPESIPLLALPFKEVINTIETPLTNTDSAYLEDVKVLDTVLNKVSVLVNAFHSTSAIQALFSVHESSAVDREEFHDRKQSQQSQQPQKSEFEVKFVRQLNENFISAQMNLLKIREYQSIIKSLLKSLELKAGNCQERTFLAGFLLEKDRLSFDVVMTEDRKHCAILFHGKSAKWLLDPWCLRYFKYTNENLKAFMAYDKKAVNVPNNESLKDGIRYAASRLGL